MFELYLKHMRLQILVDKRVEERQLIVNTNLDKLNYKERYFILIIIRLVFHQKQVVVVHWNDGFWTIVLLECSQVFLFHEILYLIHHQMLF
jgi:hypothetical protein